MKLFVLSVLVACAAADVSHLVGVNANAKSGEANAEILKQELDVGQEGQYQWAFETGNGISASAQGALDNPQAENPAQIVQGQAQWTDPNGEVVSLQYTADQNGYQPQGSHLPTPPPVPEAILRALKYIQEHPPAPENPEN